ncbi:MAG: flippase-like domain-containing protein [Chitinophagaceae bacterium]|nr:flippase-like domain-containing protein [Chitinophagaceae bacterium]
MNKKILSILQYMFFLGLGIFLVWWSLRKMDAKGWADMRNAFANARYAIIIPIVIALLASHYSRAIRWKILMEPLGYKPRTSNTYLAVLIGYMANLAIPRLGEILKCTVLARYEKVPADKLIGTIVAERAFDVVCLLIVMGAAFLTQTDIIGDYLSQRLNDVFGSKTDSLSWSKILLLVGIVAAVLCIFWWLLRRFSHLNFIVKTKKVIKGIWQGVTSVRNVKQKGWFLFHTAFIWAMYLLSVRLGFFALQETSAYSWKEALSVLTTGSIAMIVPTPGGLGVYPLFVQTTMQLYGLKDTLGFAFGALMWSVQFFQMLLSGFVALILFPFFNKKAKADA